MTGRAGLTRALNDTFRGQGPAAGDWLVTAGVYARGPSFVAEAIRAVTAYEAFTPDNDPHGEHDFGALSIEGEKLFWKIDYYDLDLEFGSENPADGAITRRVMTIMLASEY